LIILDRIGQVDDDGRSFAADFRTLLGSHSGKQRVPRKVDFDQQRVVLLRFQPDHKHQRRNLPSVRLAIPPFVDRVEQENVALQVSNLQLSD